MLTQQKTGSPKFTRGGFYVMSSSAKFDGQS